jgi:hypothetical protein
MAGAAVNGEPEAFPEALRFSAAKEGANVTLPLLRKQEQVRRRVAGQIA